MDMRAIFLFTVLLFTGCSVEAPKDASLDVDLTSVVKKEQSLSDEEISKLEASKLNVSEKFKVSDEEREVAQKALKLKSDELKKL